jgi:hypothetical protein
MNISNIPSSDHTAPQPMASSKKRKGDDALVSVPKRLSARQHPSSLAAAAAAAAARALPPLQSTSRKKLNDANAANLLLHFACTPPPATPKRLSARQHPSSLEAAAPALPPIQSPSRKKLNDDANLLLSLALTPPPAIQKERLTVLPSAPTYYYTLHVHLHPLPQKDFRHVNIRLR